MTRILLRLSAGLATLGLACAVHAQSSGGITPTQDTPPGANIANQPANPAMSGPPANEAQAKELVLRDGYTDVGRLTQGNDGTWRGTAKRGEQQMQVTIDREGKVSP